MTESRRRILRLGRIAPIAAIVTAMGFTTGTVHAISAYQPGMVLTVTPISDTTPNTPCALTTSGNTMVSSGPCSLRGAIDAANQYLYSFNEPATNTTGDSNGACPTEVGGIAPSANPLVQIVLRPGTYNLTNGALNINGFCDSTNFTFAGNQFGVVQIQGSNASQTVIDGSGNLAAHPDSVFTTEIPVQMSGVTVTGGQGSYNENCSNLSYCGGGMNIENALTLSNSVVTGNSTTGSRAGNGGGIFANDWNAMSLTNVQVTNNVAVNGGGIWNDGGHMNLTKVTISNNAACRTYSNPAASPSTPGNVCVDTNDSFGGGVFNWAAMTVTGGSISSNTAGSLSTGHGAGGGLYNSWTIQLNRVTMANNIAGNVGGGIRNAGNVVFNGGSLRSNRAGSYAGAIQDGGCDHRSSSTDNRCSGSGDDTELIGVAISGNTAGGTFDCKPLATNSSYTACTQDVGTPTSGTASTTCPGTLVTGESCFSIDGIAGAIYTYESTKVTGGSITGNVAVSVEPGATHCSSEGGADWNYDDPLSFQSTQVANNVASCGGGVYEDEDAPTTVTSTRFTRNTATLDGGAFYIYEGNSSEPPTGQLVLTSSMVLGNHAGTMTGGVYNSGLGNFLLEFGSNIVGNTGGSCPNVTVPCG